MQAVIGLALQDTVTQLDAILTLDSQQTQLPMMSALKLTQAAYATAVEGRFAHTNPVACLTLDLCRDIISERISKTPSRTPMKTMELFLEQVVHATVETLLPHLLDVDQEHAILEQEHQMAEAYRLSRDVTPPSDPDVILTEEQPRAGFSQYKLLAVAKKDLQIIGASLKSASHSDFFLAREHLRHLIFVLHECYMPTQMTSRDNPEDSSLPTVSLAETFLPEEFTRAGISRQQRISIAVILKVVAELAPTWPEGSSTTHPDDFTKHHTQLELCASVLEECSLFLLLVTKQLCATTVVCLDECLPEDEGAVHARLHSREPLTSATTLPVTYDSAASSGLEGPTQGINSSLMFVNGSALSEENGVVSVVPTMLVCLRDFAVPATHKLFNLFCDQVGSMMRANPSVISGGGDAPDTAMWAKVTALACAIPYTLEGVKLTETRNPFGRVISKGTLSFLVGLTAGEGLLGGDAIHTTLLCFLSLGLERSR